MDPKLFDFGELNLRNQAATGDVRVDFYRPVALPTWGDGDLTILGTHGYIEPRKYVDVGGAPGTDHLILATGSRCKRMMPLTPSDPNLRLAQDIETRLDTTMTQTSCFMGMELAL